LKTIEWSHSNEHVELPKNLENKDDTVLNKLSLDDENFSADTLNIAQVSCILASTWLKVCEDSFIELRFEVIDALVNTVSYHSSILIVTCNCLDTGTKERWLYDVSVYIDFAVRDRATKYPPSRTCLSTNGIIGRTA
jgi:hypothetical protein